MKKNAMVIIILLILSSCSPGAGTRVTDHADEEMRSSLNNRLANSPRHQEWVDIENGDRKIHTFVVYPERSTSAPVVLLIHENRGLSDWVRSMADQIAEEGYIAVAPDLLSGFSEELSQTSDFSDDDARIAAISKLQPDAVASDLLAVSNWAKTIPSSDQKVVSAGFCWGGSQSFALAAKNAGLSAALVFYGSGPKEESVYSDISVPVFGFYGETDERIGATIPATETAMNAAGKSYDYIVYEGAGHAFMRLGEGVDASEANAAARASAWQRMKKILSEI